MTTFTTRHYQVVANIIGECPFSDEAKTWWAKRFATTFAADNERFKPELFYDWIGVTPLKIVAYCNQNPMGMLRGYEEADPMLPYPVELERYFEQDDSEEHILSKTFRLLNRVDGDEPVPDGFRSLSVGDVVVITRDGATSRWACANLGWMGVENELTYA